MTLEEKLRAITGRWRELCRKLEVIVYLARRDAKTDYLAHRDKKRDKYKDKDTHRQGTILKISYFFYRKIAAEAASTVLNIDSFILGADSVAES